VRFKPESLDNLVKLTKFNKRELKLMYRGFKQVSSGASSLLDAKANETNTAQCKLAPFYNSSVLLAS